MEIRFKQGDTLHQGTVTTIEKDSEFQYLLNLDGKLHFTIRLSDDGYWETDTPGINPHIVMNAGDAIENMEDLNDVLTQLDSLRN